VAGARFHKLLAPMLHSDNASEGRVMRLTGRIEANLATLTKNTVCFGGKSLVTVLAKPTAVQNRALQLLGAELSGA
jgi:hypothetical protein